MKTNALNVLYMSGGTCTHFQISTKLSVPLLIHGFSHRFLLITLILNNYDNKRTTNNRQLI